MNPSKKQRTTLQADCPCGSGLAYTHCCQPLHLGQAAASAEALMRSRYSAYVLNLNAYILATWHPQTRPPTIVSDPAIKWLGLKVLSATLFTHEQVNSAPDGDHQPIAQATVEFIATYKQGGKRAEKLHEISRFERLDRWYYLDGEHTH